MKPDLTVFKGKYMICQSDRNGGIPDWVDKDAFFSFTRTDEEVSIICKQSDIETNKSLNTTGNRRIIKVNGPLDLSLTGIFSEISGTLAKSSIPIFTISTYYTDYILVKDEDLENAVAVLQESGYNITFVH